MKENKSYAASLLEDVAKDEAGIADACTRPVYRATHTARAEACRMGAAALRSVTLADLEARLEARGGGLPITMLVGRQAGVWMVALQGGIPARAEATSLEAALVALLWPEGR